MVKFTEKDIANFLIESNGYNAPQAAQQAKKIHTFDSKMDQFVVAWLKGEDIRSMAHGEFSIGEIMALRRTDDIVKALKLMNEYLLDEDIGRAMILEPWMD